MNIVIVEDEELIAQRLSRLVCAARTEAKVVGVASSFADAMRLLARHAGTVVLLDLNLGGQDGFALLRDAVAEGWRTIVVSAHVERAIEAFELGVVDFVPKPFTVERLKTALERASARTPNSRLRYLSAYFGTGTVLIALEDIVAIHGADDYSQIQTSDGRRLLHKKTLQELSEELPPPFARVHRSHIVNLRFGQQLRRASTTGYKLTLATGEVLPVGRRFLNTVLHLSA